MFAKTNAFVVEVRNNTLPRGKRVIEPLYYCDLENKHLAERHYTVMCEKYHAQPNVTVTLKDALI